MMKKDKFLHFLAGIAFFVFAVTVTGNRNVALAGSIMIGIGKELVDDWRYGEPDIWDFLATVYGGLIAWIAHHDLGE